MTSQAQAPGQNWILDLEGVGPDNSVEDEIGSKPRCGRERRTGLFEQLRELLNVRALLT